MKELKYIKTEIILEYDNQDTFFTSLNNATDKIQERGYEIVDIKYSYGSYNGDEDVNEVFSALIIFKVDDLNDCEW